MNIRDIGGREKEERKRCCGVRRMGECYICTCEGSMMKPPDTEKGERWRRESATMMEEQTCSKYTLNMNGMTPVKSPHIIYIC
jgi:hypothetical protein